MLGDSKAHLHAPVPHIASVLQIRLHLAHLGHPILGDDMYGLQVLSTHSPLTCIAGTVHPGSIAHELPPSDRMMLGIWWVEARVAPYGTHRSNCVCTSEALVFEIMLATSQASMSTCIAHLDRRN